MKILKYIFYLFLGLLFFWLVILRLFARFSSGTPCPFALSKVVDNPLRRRYILPALERVGIQKGEHILELGPGPGAFTLLAAQKAGEEGKITAVDIQPKMIAALQEKLETAGVKNVEPQVASAHSLPLEDASVDRAFLITVLPEVPEQEKALKELHRVLKPGGTLSISEEFLDPDYPLAGSTIRRVEACGFKLDRRFGNWFMYTLNFIKV